MQIDRAIDSTLANRTSIVIATGYPPSSAGHILVMEQGRIVEEGSHDSLMGTQGASTVPCRTCNSMVMRGEWRGEWFGVREEEAFASEILLSFIENGSTKCYSSI
ncbi:MAG: hypothetical protein KKC76_19855 [Proteobacteria bacterium]|nr:hypothetical protein [Pseudomonadota bacterium]MBU4298150.1 hypothetical protein [Pseudomonadota bacterium]MCG2748352.1 hypothetical protein [Desulfobulbaceae bacterium]